MPAQPPPLPKRLPPGAFPILKAHTSCSSWNVPLCLCLGVTAPCFCNAPSQTHIHPSSPEKACLVRNPPLPHADCCPLCSPLHCEWSSTIAVFTLKCNLFHVNLPTGYTKILGFYSLGMPRTLCVFYCLLDGELLPNLSCHRKALVNYSLFFFFFVTGCHYITQAGL